MNLNTSTWENLFNVLKHLEHPIHQFVMGWFLVLRYILCPFASLVQVLGLILLYRRRKVSRNRNQRYILIRLWLTESAFGIFNIFYLFTLLPRWVINIFETYLSVLYYSFMILLTSDRFLLFYLNMKYPIHCTSKKLLKIFFQWWWYQWFFF